MLRKPHKQKYPGSQSAENHKNIFDCDKTALLSDSIPNAIDSTYARASAFTGTERLTSPPLTTDVSKSRSVTGLWF